VTDDELRDILHTATNDALRPAYTNTEIRVRAETQVQIANAVIAGIRAKEASIATVVMDRPDLEEIRNSLFILQMNAEGCLAKHHDRPARLFGLPGWFLDTKAALDGLTEILWPKTK
jgi:hypothetical protein